MVDVHEARSPLKALYHDDSNRAFKKQLDIAADEITLRTNDDEIGGGDDNALPLLKDSALDGSSPR